MWSNFAKSMAARLPSQKFGNTAEKAALNLQKKC